ncbi:MAG: hypothetical protein ABMA25_16410 [Ilumatobacteraceae bacterium]
MLDLEEQFDAASGELRAHLTTVAFAPASRVLQRLHRRRRVGPVAALLAVAGVVAVAAVTMRENTSVAPTGSSVVSTASIATTEDASAQATTAPALVVGDSLDLGAREELVAAGLLVNADINRQATPETVLSVIEPLRDNDTLPDVVIVHLGSNAPASAEDYNRIAQLLADRRLVIFVTVHVNASWESQNNEHIQGLPSRYPNVEIVDWAAQVDAGNVPGGVAPDGFHLLTVEARQFYTELLLVAVSAS